MDMNRNTMESQGQKPVLKKHLRVVQAQPSKKEMVWTCNECQAANSIKDQQCATCGAPR